MRLLKFEYDECEITGATSGLHLHHVIFRSHGGDDLRCNIICMAEAVHSPYHRGNPRVQTMVARYVDEHRPDVACYIAEKLGGADPLLEWFARHGIPNTKEAAWL